MDKVAETLQGDYDAFINQQEPLGFFSSLADYVGYVLQTPETKNIVDDAMQVQQAMLDELERLEKVSLEEMQESKKKLLKIIEDNNIDPAKLKINLASAPGVSRDHNILEQLQFFEKNQLTKSGFRSHRLGEYLFDIAVSIAKLGTGTNSMSSSFRKRNRSSL